jgi:acetyl-CoA carboxylase biotin carboxyl carrier protein
MIDIRKLKELVRLMVANELTELDLRDSEEQVTLRRHAPGQVPQVIVPSSAPLVAAAGGSAATATAAPPSVDGSPPAEDGVSTTSVEDGLVTISSPMVGTFYAAPDPDSAPYVSIGSNVGPETVVCIIEAMKIFNEIKAECTGTVAEILVENGVSVEFGQPLFRVKAT